MTRVAVTFCLPVAPTSPATCNLIFTISRGLVKRTWAAPPWSDHKGKITHQMSRQHDVIRISHVVKQLNWHYPRSGLERSLFPWLHNWARRRSKEVEITDKKMSDCHPSRHFSLSMFTVYCRIPSGSVHKICIALQTEEGLRQSPENYSQLLF